MRNLKSTCFRAAILALLGGSIALATPTIDQSQYSFDTGIPFVFPPSFQNYPVGQSFTAGLNGLLTDVTVGSNGQIQSPGTLTMEVLTGDGTGGTSLGSITQAYPAFQPFNFSTNMYAVDVNVASLGINVSAGSQYTFLFTNVTGNDFPFRGLLANDQNPYAGGRAYSGPGYGNFVAPWDLQFTTSVDQHPNTNSVPDSGSVLLMLVGSLTVLGAFRRRLGGKFIAS